ncbi:MAG: methyltransferase domain-containing protein [Chloroflexi bacterium]|nr:methyltransferase domain-containing protein [Chloroflexota bacterium]
MTQLGDRYASTRKSWENIWDKASIEAELEAAGYARAQETIRAYLPFLSKADAHLEAGSGLSAIVITLRNLGYDVHGLDYAVNALRASHRHDDSLPLAAGDVHQLPYRDNCFGSYLSFGVLEHFEHGMLPALKEAYRVVKPGGVVVLTIPYPNLIYKLVQYRRKRARAGPLADDSFYESAYTRQQLTEIVTEAGFKVELCEAASHAFTLWGLGGLFRASGYYKTSQLADCAGSLLKRILPWPFNFSTLIIARK